MTDDARRGDPPMYPAYAAHFVEDERGRWEHRESVLAGIECPKCGKDVALSADTVEWQEVAPRQWRHTEYGPPIGECCGLLLVDNFGEAEAYELGDR